MKIFSDISLWWLFPWLIACFAGAVFYYRKQNQTEAVSQIVKGALISFRALTLFLLGLLLTGILLETTESKLEKPVFIMLVDNSSSMKNYKDSSKLESSIKNFEDQLNSRYSNKFDIVKYSVDAEVNSDSPNFKGTVSNLDEGFKHIYNQYYNRNIGGICFISDGNYNKGNSPQYTADKISLTPIFSVGVGDTVKKRDQLIRNVSANDIAFYKNQFPIEVDIEASKMGNSQATVDLYQGSEKIATQEILYNGEFLDFKHISFVVDANAVGFVNYTIKIQPLEGESSLENNSRSVYVEVIDSRSKILMLSQAPHPDVSAIKQVLDKDQNSEVTSQLISDWDGQLKDVELLVWHGAGLSSNAALVNEIQKQNVAVWYIIPTGSQRNRVAELGLGVNVPADRRTDDVQGYTNTGFQLFELSDKVDQMLEKAPPVSVKFGAAQIEGASSLISQRIGPVKKSDPIFVIGKNSKSKYAVFLGEGLWRWRLSEYARTRKHEGFDEVVQKTTQYLVIKRNNDPFRVNLPKRFNTNGDVIIQAEFYNDAFEPIVDPDIQFELKNDDNRVLPYVFAKNTKDYILELGKLRSGKYEWNASTKHNGKSYEKSGAFIVEDISLEALATNADHNLLKLISDQSSGEFYNLTEMNKLLKDIGNRDDIVHVAYDETDYSNLIDWKWIFALVALFLSMEWLLRRYFGTY